ncbi:unnamed protein product [Soboliphyme baturini]|uniref:Reverse transcriptase n=1 Tax=Soboliphyme baturini TaxID=241478 RepID=A0A183IKF8_9BILA|nr:unnamed protein product [Soboliphyme baturini]
MMISGNRCVACYGGQFGTRTAQVVASLKNEHLALTPKRNRWLYLGNEACVFRALVHQSEMGNDLRLAPHRVDNFARLANGHQKTTTRKSRASRETQQLEYEYEYEGSRRFDEVHKKATTCEVNRCIEAKYIHT